MSSISLAAGTRLGPYELIEPLGSGGMGEVWKAVDTRVDRIVAVKFSGERFSSRLDREAHAIAALNHPNICTLFDIAPDFVVMEYVEGSPVHGPMPVDDALASGVQIAAVLQAAHACGIVHRNLKPANILVTKAGIKVLDFGLAKNSAAPQYMSPEQLEDRPADTRSDIFAFGLVLYELIAGHPPFQSASPAGLTAAILKAYPEPLSQSQPVIPPALDRLVLKCLAKDPGARWQSAADLRDELEWIVQAQAAARLLAEPAGQKPAKPRWLPVRLRGSALLFAAPLLLFALLLVLSGALAWAVFHGGLPAR